MGKKDARELIESRLVGVIGFLGHLENEAFLGIAEFSKAGIMMCLFPL